MAAVAPTRRAHLGRTAPTGAVPAAVPPTRMRPGPAWWPTARLRRGAAARLGAQPRRDCGELIPAGSAPRAQRRARAARPQSLRGPRAAPQRRACRPHGACTRVVVPARTPPSPAQPLRTLTHTAAGCPPARLNPALAIRAATPQRRRWEPGMGVAVGRGELLGSFLGGASETRGTDWSRCVAPMSPGSHYLQAVQAAPEAR